MADFPQQFFGHGPVLLLGVGGRERDLQVWVLRRGSDRRLEERFGILRPGK